MSFSTQGPSGSTSRTSRVNHPAKWGDVSLLVEQASLAPVLWLQDGRGFTLARRLRLMGYRGRLRAKGHVIADQYAMMRRAGFDEVEIPHAMARRQPEDQWLRRAQWQAHDYQARLRG